MTARRAAAAVLAALAAALLPACDKLFTPSATTFRGIDVTGSDIGTSLALTDPSGKPRTLADFRGKVVVVTFGYTHCPDVCPTTLSDLAAAMKRLGPDADRVQVLFVTVDPARDTPELLAQYVPAFDPRFLGLLGTPEEIARATKAFHVFSSVSEGRTPESYTVSHSGQVFVLDREGKARLVFAPGLGAEAMAADLKLLLNA